MQTKHKPMRKLAYGDSVSIKRPMKPSGFHEAFPVNHTATFIYVDPSDRNFVHIRLDAMKMRIHGKNLPSARVRVEATSIERIS